MATRWLAVLLPWLVAALLAGIGWMRRHRGSRGRARGAVRELRARLAAGDDPGAALVAYLAARLGVAGAAVHGPDLAVRLRRSGVDPGLAGAVAEAVEAHDAGRYGGGGTVDRVRVEELVRRLEAVAWRGVGAVGSCLAAVLIAGAAPAQDARAGVAACHDGDHAAAVRHFRAAVDAVPDGRVLYDLGHALYRLDRLAEARWAYECALLRLPRDPDVRANLALVRRRLGADDVGGSSFSDSLDALRRLATDGERLVLCAVLQALAAALLLAGVGTTRRRIGAVLLAPALLMAVETLWWAPHRPPRAVLVGPAQVVSEPRVGMEPLGRAPAGAVARHLGGSEDWARIRLGDCTGFVPAKVLRVVE